MPLHWKRENDAIKRKEKKKHIHKLFIILGMERKSMFYKDPQDIRHKDNCKVMHCQHDTGVYHMRIFNNPVIMDVLTALSPHYVLPSVHWYVCNVLFYFSYSFKNSPAIP
jgi:hypothetical protein